MGIQDVDEARWKDSHEFLAEELMIPMLGSVDGSRALMATGQLIQSVVLENGEPPRVFTGYEKMVGEYSSAWVVADQDYELVQRVAKNRWSGIAVVRGLRDGKIHAFRYGPARPLTEGFCYREHSVFAKTARKGKIYKEGEVLSRSDAYDEHGNLCFGVNLVTTFMATDGTTFEDAIVVSESAAAKMGFFKLEVVDVSLNTNDVLLNLYGDEDTYQAFPKVGEEVRDGVVCARRRMSKEEMLRTLSNSALSTLTEEDAAFYVEKGTVVDVEVFSNMREAEMETYPHTRGQLYTEFLACKSFWTECRDALAPYVENQDPSTYTEEAGYLWRRSRDAVDPGVQWRAEETSSYDGVIVRIHVLAKHDLITGCKLSNRYGGKGVISVVLPDDQMPTTKDGVRAEVVLNPLGVVNRLNPAQMIELELNALAEHELKKVRRLHEKGKTEKAAAHVVSVVRELSTKAWADLVERAAEEDAEALVLSVLSEGIRLHQPPFWETAGVDLLRRAYDARPDYREPEVEGMEGGAFFAPMYFLRLKHEPKSKFSARSAHQASTRNVPTKSSAGKQHREPYPKTPIRVGEQEAFNLCLANDPAAVTKLISQHSSNPSDRKALIQGYLTGDPFGEEEHALTGAKSDVGHGLDVLLRGLGVRAKSSPRSGEQGNNDDD